MYRHKSTLQNGDFSEIERNRFVYLNTNSGDDTYEVRTPSKMVTFQKNIKK